MSLQEGLLLVKLSEFFKDAARVHAIKPIIQMRSRITLTLLDWFVTNYSRAYNVEFVHPLSGATINVFTEYQRQLQEFTKKQSDPFNRDGTFEFYYKDDEYMETSVKQLCFFRWAIQTGILDHVLSRQDDYIQLHRQHKLGRLAPGITRKRSSKALKINQNVFVVDFT